MRPSLALLAVLLLAPFAAPGASAQPQDAQPLDRLLPQIRRTVPGQFLDAERIDRNGSPGYRLKMLTPEGRVIERDVDARTGRMMGPDRQGYGGEDFGREPEGRAQPPRGNFFPRGDDDGGSMRFDRALPPRDFGEARGERFNRPGFGGFGNRGERFGGAAPGQGRRFGGGRARGPGGGD